LLSKLVRPAKPDRESSAGGTSDEVPPTGPTSTDNACLPAGWRKDGPLTTVGQAGELSGTRWQMAVVELLAAAGAAGAAEASVRTASEGGAPLALGKWAEPSDLAIRSEGERRVEEAGLLRDEGGRR